MWGRRGMLWLSVVFWLLSLVCFPWPAMAGEVDAWRNPGWRLPYFPIAAQGPMEAQMLGEKPFQAQSSLRQDSLLLGLPPRLDVDGDSAVLRLPKNLEVRISFLYNHDPSLESKPRSDASLLVKYSMDYRLLPNLQVGLSGYLYHPKADDSFAFQRQVGDRVFGVGPGIKYDLGRWSFLVKSQLETGNRDRGDGLQNWFRVWYAF
jgi:hypothetical protein